jgi:hypothetical protein
LRNKLLIIKDKNNCPKLGNNNIQSNRLNELISYLKFQKETQLEYQERKKREFIEFLRRERLNEKLKLREELFKKSGPEKHTPLLSLPGMFFLTF